jgi:hypothetical protein
MQYTGRLHTSPSPTVGCVSGNSRRYLTYYCVVFGAQPSRNGERKTIRRQVVIAPGNEKQPMTEKTVVIRGAKTLARRHQRRRIEVPPPANELEAMVELHLEALAVKQYSEQTIKARRDQFKVFLRWCAGQAVKPTVPVRLRHLYWNVINGTSFTIARKTANHLASALNTECSYLCGAGFDG